MAFIKKIWKDRISAFPARRNLLKEDGTTEIVTVSREEGEISQEGDTFSALNMNDLEDRVYNSVEEATNIAKGRNRARVFATTAAMESWLKDAANKGVCIVGDNLYIEDVDVPDWWVSEVLTDADSTTGYYYKIAQLETQKVDLTTIEAALATKVTNSFASDCALYSDANGRIVASGAVSSTELGFLNGVTNYIQTQLDNHGIDIDDLLARFSKTGKQISDWNSATETGIYYGNNASNGPGVDWVMGFVFVYHAHYIVQEVWHFTGGDTNYLCAKYVRQKVGNGWRKWHNIPLTYLEGVTSNIQTQLNSKYGAGSQPLFSGIGIGASGTQAYIYSEGENVNFRYKRGDGTIAYASLRNILKGTISGTTLNLSLK